MQRPTNERLSRRQVLRRAVSGGFALSVLATALTRCAKPRSPGLAAQPTDTPVAPSGTVLPEATKEKTRPTPSSMPGSAPRPSATSARPPTATAGSPAGGTSVPPSPTAPVARPPTVGIVEPPPPGVVAVAVDRTKPIATSRLDVGVSLTENTFNPQRGDRAVIDAKRLLRGAGVFQNQHIMAWGADDPWPDPAQPGPTEWASLDRRIALIRETGGVPVITLAQAPWWMKGLTRDDEWRSVAYERRVRDDMLDKWVQLCRRVAERYAAPPYNVRHYQVWNEMKGYFNAATNNYDSGNSAGYAGEFAHGYTFMYNLVYDALKAVEPKLLIGGPYVVMDSWSNRATMSDPSDVSGPYGTLDQRPLDVIATWLKEKRGADFLAVAGTTTNDVPSGGETIGSDRRGDYFTATQKFADVKTWISQRTDLPVWWSEWRAFDTPTPDLGFSNAVMACSLLRMVEGGVRAALLWGPEGDANGVSFPQGLWTDTNKPGGGRPTPYYATQQAFHEYFKAGTPRYAVTTSSAQILALASAQKVLVINTAPTPVAILLAGVQVQLAEYAVRFLDLPAGYIRAPEFAG